METSWLTFSRYPELRDLFLHQLEADLLSSRLVMSTLQEKFEEYVAGELPYARDGIVKLYDLLSGDKPSDPTEPLSPDCKPPSTSLPLNPLGWGNLKEVIATSLNTGMFIDCKFYAPIISVQPSNPPHLQPLHFCSSVNPGVIQNISSGSVLCVFPIY
jgi:hypothetical protein